MQLLRRDVVIGIGIANILSLLLLLGREVLFMPLVENVSRAQPRHHDCQSKRQPQSLFRFWTHMRRLYQIADSAADTRLMD
jgi:hypothetical protein